MSAVQPSILAGPPLADEPGLGELTLPGWFRAICTSGGDAEALVYYDGGLAAGRRISWSYSAMWDRANAVARALIACGVGKGTRVGVLMTNRPEFLSATFGIAQAGTALPERVFGPHSIVSFTTEWRSYTFTQWGSMHRRTDLNMAELGFTGPMAGPEQDPIEEARNPENTDGAYIGPSRGHLFPRWARFIGMPRGYGYGASMGAWITDYFAGWAGEWGMVRHSVANYRSPALTGDITVMTGNILDKFVDADGRHMIAVDCRMTNQNGSVLATAKAEIELPKKPG